MGLCVSRRELETAARSDNETALASEMAETISSQGSKATVQFAANEKPTKLTKIRMKRTLHARTK